MSSVLSPLALPLPSAVAFHAVDCRHPHLLASTSDDVSMTNKLRSPTHLLSSSLSARSDNVDDGVKADDSPPSALSSPSTPSSPPTPSSLSQSASRVDSLSTTASTSPRLLSPKAHHLPASQLLSAASPTPSSPGVGLPGAASLLAPAVVSALLQKSARSSSPSPPPLLPELPLLPPQSSPSPSPVPFAFPAPPYPDDSLATRQLKFIYRVFHHVCDIYFAVDKDLDGLGESRKRTGATNGARRDIPDTVSPGYGELARSGFDKVCHYLCEEAPEWLRMDGDCRFLDIGSGFGKCVLHAKVRGRVKESAGIEFIPVRHEKAAETLHYLRARFVPGLTDGKSAEAVAGEAELWALMNAIDLDGVQLIQGDITDERHHPLLYRASHIYMFDVVFSDVTMAQILPLIERSNFALFACYHRPTYLERMGCHQFVCIHKMAMKTTGKQSFTCYIYAKASAGSKVTRSREQQWKKEDVRPQPAQTQGGGTKKKRRVRTRFNTKKPATLKRKAQSQLEEQHDDGNDRDGDEDDEEEAASDDGNEDEEEAEDEDEDASPGKSSQKSRGPKRRNEVDMPAVPPEAPRARQLTNTAAESLATDAFQAMVAKAVAARLVAEQERIFRREWRAEMRAQLNAQQEAASTTVSTPSPPPAPPTPTRKGSVSGSAQPMFLSLVRGEIAAQDALKRATAEAMVDGLAMPLMQRPPTLVTDMPPPELNPRAVVSPSSASAAVPASDSAAAAEQPLNARTQRLLEVEQAKANALPLLAVLLPFAVSAAVQAIEAGERSSPESLLDSMELPYADGELEELDALLSSTTKPVNHTPASSRREASTTLRPTLTESPQQNGTRRDGTKRKKKRKGPVLGSHKKGRAHSLKIPRRQAPVSFNADAVMTEVPEGNEGVPAVTAEDVELNVVISVSPAAVTS